MQPHQQRVVDELTEAKEVQTKLNDRTPKLGTFIAGNPLFLKLDAAEQARLTTQRHLMNQIQPLWDRYTAILDERIAAFPPDA